MKMVCIFECERGILKRASLGHNLFLVGFADRKNVCEDKYKFDYASHYTGYRHDTLINVRIH